MNAKFWISAAVMFVLAMALGMFVHHVLLGDAYKAIEPMFRPHGERQQVFGAMIAAHVMIALGFTWIYVKGREAARPWLGQGLRFGIAWAVAATIPMYLIYFVILPFPSDLVAQQIVYDSLCIIVMAIVLAWLNR